MRIKGITNRSDLAEITKGSRVMGRARSAIMRSCPPCMESLCQSWMNG